MPLTQAKPQCLALRQSQPLVPAAPRLSLYAPAVCEST
jgi:hypothetical protein